MCPFSSHVGGKIERYHRSMKNLLLLEHYYLPQELEARIEEWVNYYNYHRYHESLDNLTPADVYSGRKGEKLQERKKVKQQTIIKRKADYIYHKLSIL